MLLKIIFVKFLVNGRFWGYTIDLVIYSRIGYFCDRFWKSLVVVILKEKIFIVIEKMGCNGKNIDK